MISSLLWLALGAAGAFEAEKAMERVRARVRPSGVTGALLDKVNEKLEENAGRSRRASAPPRG